MSGKVGDNVFRASGVIAAAAAGRTGTVDWITTPKVTGDSPVTGVTAKGYFLNTTDGVITINLPAGVAGSIVSMADYAATWQTNNVTVAANGSEKIGGVAQDATLDTKGQSVTFVYVDSTQGWLNTMDSTSNVRGSPPFVNATGGTPCAGETSGDYRYHTFTGPGTLCVSGVSGCAAENVVSYLVVAGGGGGGGRYAAGAGAGGFREYKNSCDPYTASPLNGNPCGTAITVAASPYPITVGAAAAGGTCDVNGTKGNDSVFSTITSTGGGYGGSEGGSPSGAGGPGGSGGGARYGLTGGTGNDPPVAPAQGFAGGNGYPTSPYAAGGGGGATEAGVAGTSPVSGRGGVGATTSITASPLAYAGGGGGGQTNTAAVGAASPCGTGGAGSPSGGSAGAGTTNRGGAGGGNFGGSPGPTGSGGAGGSGVVIIRYKFQ